MKKFDLVVSELKKGLTIDQACKNLSINRRKFYFGLTKVQKNELIKIKHLYRPVKGTHMNGNLLDLDISLNFDEE